MFTLRQQPQRIVGKSGVRRHFDAASAAAVDVVHEVRSCRPRAYCSEITTADCVCAPATDA
jgi:hypothetical protein